MFSNRDISNNEGTKSIVSFQAMATTVLMILMKASARTSEKVVDNCNIFYSTRLYVNFNQYYQSRFEKFENCTFRYLLLTDTQFVLTTGSIVDAKVYIQSL